MCYWCRPICRYIHDADEIYPAEHSNDGKIPHFRCADYQRQEAGGNYYEPGSEIRRGLYEEDCGLYDFRGAEL